MILFSTWAVAWSALVYQLLQRMNLLNIMKSQTTNIDRLGQQSTTEACQSFHELWYVVWLCSWWEPLLLMASFPLALLLRSSEPGQVVFSFSAAPTGPTLTSSACLGCAMMWCRGVWIKPALSCYVHTVHRSVTRRYSLNPMNSILQ